MKFLMPLVLLAALSNQAHAHPGGHRLECRSKADAKQKVEISLARSNGKGWVAPMINIVVNGKEILLNTPDEMGDYGSTFHNSPLKVITVTAEAAYEDNANGGYFSVIAVPETVKAFDIDNQPVIWSMEAEKDECNDTNGRAEFKGILKGFLHTEDQKDIYLDTQLMDCELKYNSGMSC